MAFRDDVYSNLKKVPKGFVVTYGQLAKISGNPKAARAVGMFMRENPNAPTVPCHRVVASDGSLTGYSGVGGVPQKKEMLLKEGGSFVGEKVNLAKSRWMK